MSEFISHMLIVLYGTFLIAISLFGINDRYIKTKAFIYIVGFGLVLLGMLRLCAMYAQI